MTSQSNSRVVACVLVLVGVCASDPMAVMCLERRDCTTQHKIQTINWFFDHLTPKTAEPPFTLNDIRHLIFQRVEQLKSVSASLQGTPGEARQYYGATGYGNYYGNTGYPGYGLYSAGTSSTSFNGLDAGLSALAFLAFGVWLFNLVLPQLQGVGLGLPGLRRRNVPHDASGGLGSHVAQSPGILSNILSSSQDLLNNIFNKGTSRQSKLLTAGWSSGETINQTRNTLISRSDNIRESTMSTEDLVSTAAKSRTASDLQHGNRLTKGTARKPSPVLQGPSSELSNQINVPGDLWNSSRTWNLSEVNDRGRRRVEGAEGQGLLEQLLGEAWRPLAYLLSLLEELDGQHQFPKSRIQVSLPRAGSGQ